MLLDFVFELEQLELICVSLFDSWLMRAKHLFESLCGRPPWLFEATAGS